MFKHFLAVGFVTSVLAALATGAMAQKAPPELPVAIMCWNEKTKIWVVGHLSTVKEDGSASYVGRLSGTVNSKGFVEPPSNRPVAIDCYGKTLEQLRAMGRLVEVRRTP
jgi:hypothetical protein